jgi:uncharacterized protein (TIGR02246 family)
MESVSTQASVSTQHGATTAEPSLSATLQAFEEAFNRQDVKEVTGYWDPDGTLIGPTGLSGIGRSGVESVYASDVKTILRGTHSTFEIQRVRKLGPDVVFADIQHTVSGARMPDGSKGTMTLHLAAVARRAGERWYWLDTRPYAFLPGAPAASTH